MPKSGRFAPIVPIPEQEAPPIRGVPTPPRVIYNPYTAMMITPSPLNGLPFIYNGIKEKPFGTMPNCAIPFYIKKGDFPGIKEWVDPPIAPKGYAYFVYYWCPIPGIL